MWTPGRIVVSAPSEGTGTNLLGFARRVKSVGLVGSTIEVHTESAALQDIVTGEMQQTLDFTQMKDVDLSKLDLAWAAKSLYVDVKTLSPGIDIAPPDEAVPDSATKVLAKAMRDAWQSVTPASFEKSVRISPEIKTSQRAILFSLDPYRKSFNDRGRVPLELTVKGVGDVAVEAVFKPGAQVGMRIPNIGQDGTFATWMNVDSSYQSIIHLEVALEAKVTQAEDRHGDELGEAFSKRAQWAEEVLNQAREKFMGAPELKPAGGWKRTLFITRPATQVVMAGPVPVVLTQTFQLDLECGFEAKVGLKVRMDYKHSTVLKFSARYENGQVTGGQPAFDSHKDRQVEVTGGGGLSLSCGLIPRLNVFVYDTVGLNAGVRGSLVVRADYGVRCEPSLQETQPKSEVTLGLYGNFGVQVGGRVQTPGSSYAQKAGQELGADIGPIEVWNTEFGIYSQVWSLEGGLGYCAPSCYNTCGGNCPPCAASVRSAVAAEAVRGITDGQLRGSRTSRDSVPSGAESAMDRGVPGDESSLRLDPRNLTQSAQHKATTLAAAVSTGFAHRDGLSQSLQVLAIPPHERSFNWSNKPESWDVQSEVVGDGRLRVDSSRSEWNQVLIPVFRWGISQ
ncbi:hypothetical protein POL68_16975 [Stigmatella sp. ncwal1]|uniref:Uncharacterized protein n=1 Tax=Stigmatella ashevillensis TaxID=2995309 RepID=A0ABT5DAK8_9BACT|nr:hypothetical protein [Stigmatella ashevillena]MDC0710173.1 hypothetical protein [Stigmatella ashevillena]